LKRREGGNEYMKVWGSFLQMKIEEHKQRKVRWNKSNQLEEHKLLWEQEQKIMVLVEIIFLISFILDYYVVQEYTSLHYISKVILSPPSDRTPHHCKARLKNPKISFYIFSYDVLL
jgi:hypothetical protein